MVSKIASEHSRATVDPMLPPSFTNCSSPQVMAQCMALARTSA